MVASLFLLYLPIQLFNNNNHKNIFEYVIKEGLKIFDACYFFVSRMMFYYISRVISLSGGGIIYIVVAGLYGLFVLIAWGRCFYQYHKGTL